MKASRGRGRISTLGAVLRTLIVGSPPPVSVVRSIQDTRKPLVELMPQGYSIPLLQAIDKALALHMEDRPQSIEEFAALIEMPAAGIDEVLTAKEDRHDAGAGGRGGICFRAGLATLQASGAGGRGRAGWGGCRCDAVRRRQSGNARADGANPAVSPPAETSSHRKPDRQRQT